MAIDNNTGAIDLTKSETGMKCLIGFVPAGTTDTCPIYVLCQRIEHTREPDE